MNRNGDRDFLNQFFVWLYFNWGQGFFLQFLIYFGQLGILDIRFLKKNSFVFSNARFLASGELVVLLHLWISPISVLFLYDMGATEILAKSEARCQNY